MPAAQRGSRWVRLIGERARRVTGAIRTCSFLSGSAASRTLESKPNRFAAGARSTRRVSITLSEPAKIWAYGAALPRQLGRSCDLLSSRAMRSGTTRHCGQRLLHLPRPTKLAGPSVYGAALRSTLAVARKTGTALTLRVGNHRRTTTVAGALRARKPSRNTSSSRNEESGDPRGGIRPVVSTAASQ